MGRCVCTPSPHPLPSSITPPHQVDALSHCTSLRLLELRGAVCVCSISPLRGCPSLEVLHLDGCLGLGELEGLEGCCGTVGAWT